MSYKILEKINSPADLKELSEEDVLLLSDEVREFLVEEVEKTGGHLASNLGVVELTLAIHRVFDSPKDHIIFDVGHQAYVHKIVTGRRERFEDLRRPGGLSGFTLRRESEHDPFGAGHSSTSVSAALGFAEADRLSGKSCYTVCVIGDGAYTGGMVHEALNNCKPDLPLVIILNENGMSISHNRGTFASYLARVRISERYLKWKRNTNTALEKIPLIGEGLKRFLTFVKKKIKKVLYTSNYFEELGLYYIGPIDGSDYRKIEHALSEAKRIGKTVVVHVKTKKGKGYSPAEKSPDGYHSLGKAKSGDTFHSVFAEELIDVAESDEKIVAVTAAMGIGTGLDVFGLKFPKRYFDVGIAEEHALTFSAGLAANGYKPFAAIYSTFLQRGYDNVLHDVALQSLPVNLIIDRAGLALGDGATHHGIFDVAFLSHIPGVSLYAPASYESLRRTVRLAAKSDSPVAIRYPNSPEFDLMGVDFKRLTDSEDVLVSFDESSAPAHIIVTYGKIVENCIKARKLCLEEGIDVGIILVEKIKPYAPVVKSILPIISNSERVVYVEEGIKNGGAAMIFADTLRTLGFSPDSVGFDIIAIDDSFASPEYKCDLYDYVGLSPEKIAEKILHHDN